jgi:carbamoyltransferase
MSSGKSSGHGRTVTVELQQALRVLRESLVEHDYSHDQLRRALGISSPDDVGLLNHAAALERTRADHSPAATLVRLLYLEEAQTGADLGRCFGRSGRDRLVTAGLLAGRGKLRASRLRVDVVDGLYILADRRMSVPAPGAFGLPDGDMVYPPGGDSLLLANAAPHDDGAVLDLCTGTGVQALRSARSARRVVGTDIGKRAVALASCNAALNGIENLTVRCGDLFGPVRGERFDLILANPPFVAGPRRGPAYHAGGPFADRVLKRIVAGLPTCSKPGGRALMVSHLALRHGEKVIDRLRPWFSGAAGRALALVLEEGSPVDLAAAQSVFALRNGLASYGKEIRRWVAYLDRHRIERIVLVLLAYERRGRGRVEVVDAFQRSLPLPLSRSPKDLLDSWFTPR